MIYQKLVIYLHSLEPIKVSWVVFDLNGHITQTVLNGDLANLAPIADDYNVTVLIPAHDVLLTRITLPKLNRHRLLQALPFALEEQLIDDIEELHFAIANYQPDGSIPVAIVANEKMHHWLTLLRSFGIQPTECVSNLFGLPYAEKTWSIGIHDESCAIRTDAYSGFACDRANLTTLLNASITSADAKPDTVQIYHFSEDALDPLILADKNIVINTVTFKEDAFLVKMAEWVETQPNINLLQGPFQAVQKSSVTKKIWRYACYALIACLAVGFCKNLIAFFILHHEVSHLDEGINTIYKKNFPSATSIVAPRERMTHKLNALIQSSNNNLFLSLLARAGKVLQQNTRVQLKNLDFRDQQLNIDLTAESFDEIDALIQQLTQQGLLIKEQNAAESGAQVKANLQIERGHS